MADDKRARYFKENQKLDKNFEKSDEDFNKGKLDANSYRRKQQQQESVYNNNVKDIEQSLRNKYSDEMKYSKPDLSISSAIANGFKGIGEK